MTPSYGNIIAILDDPASAAHIAVGRMTARRSLAANEPWHWYQEWRLCLITPAGRDALLPCYAALADQNALFGDRPAILQERRLDIAPDGALHPRPWDAYHPQRTPWEAVWTAGTGVLKAEQDRHPFLAFAIERYHLYSAHMSERQQLVQQRDRLRPPDLNTPQGRRADEDALNARGVQALKGARLYTRWMRAQGDADALARLRPQVGPIIVRVRGEHLADRERRLAEVARLSEQLAQTEAEIPSLRSGAGAPTLLDGAPALHAGDVSARRL